MNKIITLDALEHFKSKIITETQHNYDDYATALKTLQDNESNQNSLLNSFNEFLNALKSSNYGNDIYDDSDITTDWYNGKLLKELKAGNYANLHPGQRIKGKTTGTWYFVAEVNGLLHKSINSSNWNDLTAQHVVLIPFQLQGNSLLWSGKSYAGSTVNNTAQGYAPWQATNTTEGVNSTGCYKDSFIKKTILARFQNEWLKQDFEDQGQTVLTWNNLYGNSFDNNLQSVSLPNLKGAYNWSHDWTGNLFSTKCELMSEPNVYGHYHCASSHVDTIMQYEQLAIFKHKNVHQLFGHVDIWLRDVASASVACFVRDFGFASADYASYVLRVVPLFAISV